MVVIPESAQRWPSFSMFQFKNAPEIRRCHHGSDSAAAGFSVVPTGARGPPTPASCPAPHPPPGRPGEAKEIRSCTCRSRFSSADFIRCAHSVVAPIRCRGRSRPSRPVRGEVRPGFPCCSAAAGGPSKACCPKARITREGMRWSTGAHDTPDAESRRSERSWARVSAAKEMMAPTVQ
jgi:hypothetical protein